MTLNLHPLRLTVVLLVRQVEVESMPYFDWLHCRVSAETPGFTADFTWPPVTPSELEKLAEDLQGLHAAFPTPGEVTFDPLEPNLRLRFELDSNGSVGGEFNISPDTFGGARLSGPLNMDQSYLPGLHSAITAFLKESQRAA